MNDKREQMGDKQIIKMARQYQLNEQLRKVWHGRHEISFPYMVNEYGVIENRQLDAFVGDREVSATVLEQADRIREKRQTNLF